MDLTIVNWIATHLRCPPLDFLMPVITMLGEYGFIWIAVCIFLLARKQTRRMGCACALSLLIAFVCGEIVLKNIVQRAQPVRRSAAGRACLFCAVRRRVYRRRSDLCAARGGAAGE